MQVITNLAASILHIRAAITNHKHPASTNLIEIETPNIMGVVQRQSSYLLYTEEVVGSSPIPPTEEIPRDGEY